MKIARGYHQTDEEGKPLHFTEGVLLDLAEGLKDNADVLKMAKECLFNMKNKLGKQNFREWCDERIRAVSLPYFIGFRSVKPHISISKYHSYLDQHGKVWYACGMEGSINYSIKEGGLHDFRNYRKWLAERWLLVAKEIGFYDHNLRRHIAEMLMDMCWQVCPPPAAEDTLAQKKQRQ